MFQNLKYKFLDVGCISKIIDLHLSQRHTKGTQGREATENSEREASTWRSRFSFLWSRKWDAPSGLPDLIALERMTYYLIKVYSTPRVTKRRRISQNKYGHSDKEPNQWWTSDRVSCENTMHRETRNYHSAKLLVHRVWSHRKKLCNFLSGQWCRSFVVCARVFSFGLQVISKPRLSSEDGQDASPFSSPLFFSLWLPRVVLGYAPKCGAHKN